MSLFVTRYLSRVRPALPPAGLALAALLPALPLGGCDRKSAQAAQQAAPPPQVGFIVAQAQDIPRITELPGRTSAVLTSDVRPQVSGVILKRLFTEGSDVKEGQQLYLIDPAPYQATYDSAVATLAHGEAALATARAKSGRYKSLVSAQAISRQDYDDSVAAEKEALADIASARASIEQAKINLAYTRVLSPISGRISHSVVTPGALVTANQANAMATVTQLDPLYVDLTQSSATLIRLRRELAAGELKTSGDGAPEVTLTLEDGSQYPLPGKLQFTEVTVDEGTGTVVLRALFPNPQHLLLPGMYVHARLQEGVTRGGILVPQVAVSRNTHGDPTVLVAGQDNTASLRVIQTGQAVGDQWVVTDGLKPGERVLVDGLQSVRPGAPVRPVPAAMKS
jgi:membrane fusion protein, multidrug efflux system